jgi:hypothetical protein
MLLAGPDTSWTVLLPGFLLAGIGWGIANPAMVEGALSAVAPEAAGMASGMVNFARQAGSQPGSPRSAARSITLWLSGWTPVRERSTRWLAEQQRPAPASRSPTGSTWSRSPAPRSSSPARRPRSCSHAAGRLARSRCRCPSRLPPAEPNARAARAPRGRGGCRLHFRASGASGRSPARGARWRAG